MHCPAATSRAFESNAILLTIGCWLISDVGRHYLHQSGYTIMHVLEAQPETLILDSAFALSLNCRESGTSFQPSVMVCIEQSIVSLQAHTSSTILYAQREAEGDVPQRINLHTLILNIKCSFGNGSTTQLHDRACRQRELPCNKTSVPLPHVEYHDPDGSLNDTLTRICTKVIQLPSTPTSRLHSFVTTAASNTIFAFDQQSCSVYSITHCTASNLGTF